MWGGVMIIKLLYIFCEAVCGLILVISLPFAVINVISGFIVKHLSNLSNNIVNIYYKFDKEE